MQERYERFSFLISTVYKNIQRIESEQMEKYGLKGSYAQYLFIIKRFPEGLTAAKLSEICGKDKAAVSRTIAKLEESKLITRICENDNLYRAKLMLTEEGLAAADFVSAKASKAVQSAGVGLSDVNRRIFYKSLDIIANNLKTISVEDI